MSDDLIARAKARTESAPVGEWGERLNLLPDESFVGRYRGTATDPSKDDRLVFLFWGPNNELRYERHYASLERQLKDVAIGDKVAVYRGDNYRTQYDAEGETSGYSFGVAPETCDDPLPSESGDDIPF
jgi:hypothetical protein